MDTSNTSPTEEIIRQNNYQMRFLDKFLLKQNVYEKNYDNCNYLFNIGL